MEIKIEDPERVRVGCFRAILAKQEEFKHALNQFSMDIKVFSIPEISTTLDVSKRIWVVCDTSADTEDLHTFLKKILSAVKVDMDKQVLQIFPNNTEPTNLEPLFKQSMPAKVLLFGVLPSTIGLNLNLTLYEVTSFRNLEILWAEKLSDIENNQDKKRQLWTSLQLIQF